MISTDDNPIVDWSMLTLTPSQTHTKRISSLTHTLKRWELKWQNNIVKFAVSDRGLCVYARKATLLVVIVTDVIDVYSEASESAMQYPMPRKYVVSNQFDARKCTSKKTIEIISIENVLSSVFCAPSLQPSSSIIPFSRPSIHPLGP